jgi:hypothetical protein
MTVSNTVQITIHLEAAYKAIEGGYFGAGNLALKNALKVANAGNRHDIKRCIFRAMNVIRPKLKDAIR